MAPTTTSSLPSSVHVSSHPCIGVKLSQLRSHTIKGRETKNLVHEIALLLGCEALRENLTVVEAGRVSFPRVVFFFLVWVKKRSWGRGD